MGRDEDDAPDVFVDLSYQHERANLGGFKAVILEALDELYASAGQIKSRECRSDVKNRIVGIMQMAARCIDDALMAESCWGIGRDARWQDEVKKEMLYELNTEMRAET